MAQTILFLSIKDDLISFVSDLSTFEEVYGKLVILYSINSICYKISPRNKLYRTRISKYEDMASYLMKVSKLKDQLQGIVKVISNSELITFVLNSLPPDWRGFVSNKYVRK